MKPDKKLEQIDSEINTDGIRDDRSTESKTPDLNASDDPNEQDDVASRSDEDVNDRRRFDGEVGI